MILEGLVMPIGTLNANGWGIPPSEVPNTIATLKQSVVRLCRDPDHACDLLDSKRHEIGAVSDAWISNNAIYAKVAINDKAAESRIKSGDLKAWSVYGQGDQHADGFVVNYKNKSLTLVADPAWSSAQFKAVAASKSSRFMLTNSFEDVNMTDKDEEKFLAGLDQKITDSQETIKKEFSELVASKDKQITDLSELVKQQAEAIKTLQASVDSITKTEDKSEDAIYASKDDLESLKTGIKTEEDIDKLIASKMSQAIEETKRNTVINDYKTFAASKSIKLEDNFFDNKTSGMIEQEFNLLKSVTASRAEPRYISVPEEFADDYTKLTVGIPDGQGNWRV